MKEQIIEFETAKLAEEKGFDEACYDCYNQFGNLYSDGWCEFIDDKNILLPFTIKDIKNRAILSPTQSLLQKWLREKHNINLSLKPIYGGSLVDGKQIGWLCYTPYQDETINKLPSVSISKDTYEEALEKGLFGALKLIKI